MQTDNYNTRLVFKILHSTVMPPFKDLSNFACPPFHFKTLSR